MTAQIHPFLAAVQAAYDAHGMPDGVESVFIGRPNRYRITPFCCVTLSSALSGYAGTLAEAYERAVADQRRRASLQADAKAKHAARKLLEANGISPSLIVE
jgi:hypothetical protein